MASQVASAELSKLAYNLFVTRCDNIAILALLVWDSSLLFGDEIKYIWTRQWSLFTLFWCLLRYPIILSHILVTVSFFSDGWSPEFCIRLTQTKTFLVWLSIFSGRLCWCLRTYALWNRKRWLVVLGVPLLIMESTTILFATMNIDYVPIPNGFQQICVASPRAGFWSLMSWVFPFSFDTALSVLSIIRAMLVSRKLKTPLTAQLIRDGFWYYGLMTSIYIMCLVLYSLNPLSLFVGAHMMIGLLGLVSARFLLNLRMLKSEDQDYKSQCVATSANETISYGVSFGVLTGVEGFVDQFELDDAPKAAPVAISMQRANWGALRGSRTSLSSRWRP